MLNYFILLLLLHNSYNYCIIILLCHSYGIINNKVYVRVSTTHFWRLSIIDRQLIILLIRFIVCNLLVNFNFFCYPNFCFFCTFLNLSFLYTDINHFNIFTHVSFEATKNQTKLKK